MDRLPSMVNMARSPKEKQETLAMSPTDAVPDYPYGLCLSFCDEELQKLGFEDNEIQVGDMIHLNAMGTVTSVSSSDSTTSGPSCRVEVQLQYIQAEDEDEEYEEPVKESKSKRDINKLYSNKG